MQTCIIFNPSARGEKAEVGLASLDRILPNCTLRRTGQSGHARELAAQAVREGFSTIIAAGGDGTVNETVNGIGDVPGGFDAVRLGVLPLGTINVFAREVGLPRRLPKTAEVLREGRTTTIDLGCVEYTVSGAPRKRFFVQLAGAGLDSRAIELVDWEMKKKMGALAYIVAGCKAMSERQPVIVAEGDNPVAGELVLIGNGRFYGGSLPLFPMASLQDGMLDICILPKVDWFRVIVAAPSLLTGWFQNLSPAVHFSRPSVTLTSKSRVILQLDGENACELPVTLTVRPKILRVIVP